jgi:ribosomal protein L22
MAEEKITKIEPKTEEKKSETKKEKIKSTGPKKTEAVVNGRNLSVGLKHSIALSGFIRGKNIDSAIEMLEQVVIMKRAVPMKGEIPHRRGMMSGRYPVKGAGIFLKLLKSLKSNAIHNEMEIEKYKLFCVPNVAPRPYKRFGQGRFKRSHVTIKLIPIKSEVKK